MIIFVVGKKVGEGRIGCERKEELVKEGREGR